MSLARPSLDALRRLLLEYLDSSLPIYTEMQPFGADGHAWAERKACRVLDTETPLAFVLQATWDIPIGCTHLPVLVMVLFNSHPVGEWPIDHAGEPVPADRLPITVSQRLEIS